MKEFISSTIKVAKKDFKSELRTRYAVNSLVMFIVVTVSIIRFAIGDEKTEQETLCGLLWIAIFFASSGGLSRVFVKEEERDTSIPLKLTFNPDEILAGKLLFNLVLSFVLSFFTVILFFVATEFTIKNPIGFILSIAAGNLGLVSASTIIAALISKANSKGTLYPVLSFPILLPVLLAAVNATKLAAAGIDTYQLAGEFQIIIPYFIVVTTLSFMLFKFVWQDT